MMVAIAKPRRGGKTSRLLMELKRDPYAILIVASRTIAHQLEQRDRDFVGRIFSFEELQNGALRGMTISQVHFDDLDQCLAKLTYGCLVGICTYTQFEFEGDESHSLQRRISRIRFTRF